jgi:hypothetical protein
MANPRTYLTKPVELHQFNEVIKCIDGFCGRRRISDGLATKQSKLFVSRCDPILHLQEAYAPLPPSALENINAEADPRISEAEDCYYQRWRWGAQTPRPQGLSVWFTA